MKKWTDWLLNRLWPWSRMRRAESLAKALLENSRLRDMNEMMQSFEMFLSRELGKARMMELVDKFNLQIADQYGVQGMLGRPDKSAAMGTFPPPGTGAVDPKLGPMGQALAQAAKEVQQKEQQGRPGQKEKAK